MGTLCWFLRGLRHERQKRKRVSGKEHTERGPSSQVCERVHTHTLAYACTHREGQRKSCLPWILRWEEQGDKAGEGLAFRLLKSPPLSEFLSDSEAAQCVCLGFHWLFHTLLEEEGGKKRLIFSSSQSPWVCATNCHCETVTVRPSLSSWKPVHGSGPAPRPEQIAALFSCGERLPTIKSSPSPPLTSFNPWAV